ncbi:MAG: NADPH-dependent F420 reductase [Gemmatimonadota bacterium]
MRAHYTILLLLVFSTAVASPSAGQAQTARETIAIVGTGNLGTTLGKRWADAGHRIIYGSRTPDDANAAALRREIGPDGAVVSQAEAVASADLVLLAVPGNLVVQIVEGLGDLTGKVVIEPTNTLTFQDGYPVSATDPRVSAAERVQEAAPGARAVKAFNTLNYSVMEDPSIAGGPVTIPLAGDDAAAKERVAQLVRDVGLEPLDVGPIQAARFLEEMLRLHIAYRFLNPGMAFDYYLRVHPHPEGY